MSHGIRDSSDTLNGATMAALHAERTRVTALFAFSCTLVLALAFVIALGDVPALLRTASAATPPPSSPPGTAPRITRSLEAEHVLRDPTPRPRARKRRVLPPPPDATTLLSRGIAP